MHPYEWRWEEPPLWSDQHGEVNEIEDARPGEWFIAGLTKRLPHLQEGNASPGTHTSDKRHHMAHGGLRWAL
jgi:hypothetical protein